MKSKKSINNRYCMLIALFLFLLLPANSNKGLSANINIVWEKPINISNSIGSSTRPAIVADQWGQLHVFWSEKEDGSPTLEGEAPEVGNLIMYSRWNGKNWTSPVDIFFTTKELNLRDPEVIVDQDGVLHLIWLTAMGVSYSRSESLSAISASSWTSSYIIGQATGVEQAEISMSSSGHIYVVYNDLNSENGPVYFISSADGGDTWTSPNPISKLVHEDAFYNIRPRIMVDNNGIIHVIWEEHTQPPEYKGYAVYYTFSDNEGENWSPQVNLTPYLKSDEVIWEPGYIVQILPDKLLFYYTAGVAPARYYRVSMNSGASWSFPTHIFGELISRAGWDAMGVDAAGTVYVIVQLRYPSSIYSSYFAENQWLDPPEAVVTDEKLYDAHFVKMVISQGNQVHVVMEQYPEGEIWYMHGVSTAPFKGFLQTPTVSTPPKATTKVTPSEITEINIHERPVNTPSHLNPTGQSSSNSTILTISILSTITAIVMSVIVYKFISQHK